MQWFETYFAKRTSRASPFFVSAALLLGCTDKEWACSTRPFGEVRFKPRHYASLRRASNRRNNAALALATFEMTTALSSSTIIVFVMPSTSAARMPLLVVDTVGVVSGSYGRPVWQLAPIRHKTCDRSNEACRFDATVATRPPCVGPIQALTRLPVLGNSHRDPRGVNSVGRVLASQAKCRGFESLTPLHVQFLQRRRICKARNVAEPIWQVRSSCTTRLCQKYFVTRGANQAHASRNYGTVQIRRTRLPSVVRNDCSGGWSGASGRARLNAQALCKVSARRGPSGRSAAAPLRHQRASRIGTNQVWIQRRAAGAKKFPCRVTATNSC